MVIINRSLKDERSIKKTFTKSGGKILNLTWNEGL